MNIIIQEYDENGKGRYALVPLDEDGSIERKPSGAISSKSSCGSFGIADTWARYQLVNTEPINASDCKEADAQTANTFLTNQSLMTGMAWLSEIGYTEVIPGKDEIEALALIIANTNLYPLTSIHVASATLKRLIELYNSRNDKSRLGVMGDANTLFDIPIYGNLYGPANRALLVRAFDRNPALTDRELFTFKLENNGKH